MPHNHHLGQRVSYDGALCTIRYVGDVVGTTGQWLGVEWDDSSRGKHDGSHKGQRYFTCLSRSPSSASFLRPTRPDEPPRSFLTALREKYSPKEDESAGDTQIVISGKVAEEMGFDKIRRQQAELGELKIVVLDGMRIFSAVDDTDYGKTISQVCPKITKLDLSRNLLEDFGPVVDICRELPALKSLVINGNRFRDVLREESLQHASGAFENVKELSLDEGILTWEEICHIARLFPCLSELKAGTNQLSSLSTLDYGSLSTTLTSIDLEFNDFAYLSDLSSLAPLTSLRNLHLKGNSISGLAPDGIAGPIFSSSLQYLDVSYNRISSWSFIDTLPKLIPGLTSLRLAHNPVYDTQDGVDNKASSSEETHMFTIARLAPLKNLNFTHITANDRTNAEMFYMSRIAKQLATVPEAAEATVLEQHPRYNDLCSIHGAPDVIRRDEINPAFLEARLVTVTFYCSKGKDRVTRRIPKSFDVYAVKGIAGRIFGISPIKLKLVWETGEWDPVAGFDEREGDSSDEMEENEGTVAIGNEAEVAFPEDQDDKPGRWVKREAELKDGPRQLGYCVDGLDVTFRVEPIG